MVACGGPVKGAGTMAGTLACIATAENTLCITLRCLHAGVTAPYIRGPMTHRESGNQIATRHMCDDMSMHSFENGYLQGAGTFGMRNGDRFQGSFFQDRPVGPGTLATIDGRRYIVEYAADKNLLDEIVPTPVSSEQGSDHVIEKVQRI